MAKKDNTGQIVGGTALGAYLTAKYGKRVASRLIDTEGFGNVSTSYKGAPKWKQALDNLTGISGRRRDVLKEIISSAKKKSSPPEIKAMKRKISLMNSKIKELESIWGKNGSEQIRNLKARRDMAKSGLKERRMASAVKERSFRNKIGFKHEGKFIEGSYPQEDPTIKRALERKGLKTNKPIPVFDASNTSQSKKLVSLSQRDPRMVEVRKLMKNNQVSKAKEYIKQFPDMTITKNGPANYTVQHVPHQNPFKKGLRPAMDYVMGGHTARAEFGKFKGKKGLHRIKTSGLDITTYVSEGETVRNSKGLQKARALLGGRFGQNIGLHEPVVSTWSYDKHRAPGGGRAKGAKDTYTRVKRITASPQNYSSNKALQRASKQKTLLKRIVKAAASLATKGKLRL
jgi:hypothetical protein